MKTWVQSWAIWSHSRRCKKLFQHSREAKLTAQMGSLLSSSIYFQLLLLRCFRKYIMNHFLRVICPYMLEASISLLNEKWQRCGNYQPISGLKVDHENPFRDPFITSSTGPTKYNFFPAQTGFMAGRHSCHNTRSLVNVICSSHRNPTKLIVSFDRVEWRFFFFWWKRNVVLFQTFYYGSECFVLAL